MLLLKNVDVYAPAAMGRADILVAGGRILRIEPSIHLPPAYVEDVDATALMAVPGFIDGHVHMTGGGGEGGYATRTPELLLSDAIRGGVTTVVGCLGTDGVTRTMAGLLAKAKALEEEGLSTFIYTGHYAVPVQTLTEPQAPPESVPKEPAPEPPPTVEVHVSDLDASHEAEAEEKSSDDIIKRILDEIEVP